MPQAYANRIHLEYERFGDENAPVIILIMGLGMQMIAWPDQFCEMLVSRGFGVIRFDNRDIGLSKKFNNRPTPGPLASVLRDVFGLRPKKLAYTLTDMANDVIGLMDFLNIAKSHIVGASMGGMIAQIVTAENPDRVISLTSIMSSSGHRRMQRPKWRDLNMLFSRRRPGDTASREEQVDYLVHVMNVIGSPGSPYDETALRDMIERALERSADFDGTLRQSAAIAASGSRREILQKIVVPTLVVHGKKDILVPPLAGFDTVMHIRGAKAEFIDDMGHDLPQHLWPRLVGAIAQHCEERT
jgi:proline iminopeptidase